MILLICELMSSKCNAGVRYLVSVVFSKVIIIIIIIIIMGTMMDTLDYKSIRYPERHQLRGKDVFCNVQ